MNGSVRRAATVVIGTLLALGSPAGIDRAAIGPGTCMALEGWKAEFEAVCAKTDIAMSLPKEELEALIARCETLKTKIEAEDESTRKVYLRRLRMCRDLYRYVLESRDPK